MVTTLLPTGLKTEQLTAETEFSLIAQAQTRHKLLSADQALTLEQKKEVRQGERALERLLASQVKYIESRIQQLFTKMPTLNREDLRQSAQEGIIAAIHSFDLSKGVRLITWAWYQISSKFKGIINGEIAQSKAEDIAQREAPDAQSQSQAQIDVVELDHVKTIVSTLKQNVQDIIKLRTQGNEFPEIGKILGKTADACRMAYNRAIQRVRQQLLPSPVIEQQAVPQNWMSRLKLRYDKNVRFKFGPHHNELRVLRRTMSKRSDQTLLTIGGLISISILGFAVFSVGRVPRCQMQVYNIGLPIFTLLTLGIPFLAGYAARGVFDARGKPSRKALRPAKSR
jgi:RNA polymerase sigma factor (sigma-70 family)